MNLLKWNPIAELEFIMTKFTDYIIPEWWIELNLKSLYVQLYNYYYSTVASIVHDTASTLSLIRRQILFIYR